MDEQQTMPVEALRQWLEAQRDEVVGYACLPRGCPLANWLSERFGQSCLVSPPLYCFGDWSSSDSFRLPRWAERLVDTIDERAVGTALFGEEVLSLLDTVLAHAENGEEVWQ